ncbi:GNAT family N-acetyltransferase [Roseococcus suduntuyensis]|uniref:GNAT superfamily N-acetyltransferase n=1 Tax=Roseococcus suduntuyensis TaxID=455361 RepID=A0A840ACC6_9PROT|nr:GNAT family N-acetyltransferase [Roseococcus suduntuyensis]MBB3897785.1 GNAT superfamily N-acetyltransferase [Roseococcus suduntuyensis]
MVQIVPLAERHRADWERLYAGYAEFYKVTQTPEMRAKVWAWIHDPAHEVNAVVAEDEAGRAVGLAHYRAFARPLSASTGCFLDDLFVDPSQRGKRVADALLEHLRALAREKGWSTVRWITADDNYRGRGVYDRLAKRTWWITYDMAP